MIAELPKVCTCCGVPQGLDQYVPYGKSRPGKVKAECKGCVYAKRRTWHANNLDKAHNSNRKWLADNSDKRAKNREGYMAKYRSLNLEAMNASARKMYRANPEKYIGLSREYARKNPEKIVLRCRAFYEKNSATIKARTTLWAASNPAKVMLYRATRRARAQRPSWAIYPDIQKVYEEARRLTRVTGVTHVVDHIYPLAGKTVSGLHTAENLRPIPYTVNARKGNKLPGFRAGELADPTGRGVFHE